VAAHGRSPGRSPTLEPMSPAGWTTGGIQGKPTKRTTLREASFGRDHRSGPSFVYYIGCERDHDFGNV
jgi:hypothetical protein